MELPQQGAAGAQADTPTKSSLSKGHWFALGVIACWAVMVSVAWVVVVGWFVLRVLRWLFGS